MSRASNGLSLQRAELYGKPHIGAYYFGDGDRHRLHHGAQCLMCGRPATDAHHIVPKGMGGGNRVYVLETPMGMFPMRSPLFALCRDHHEEFHNGLTVEWRWDTDEDRERWEDGYYLSHGYAPHDPRLFLHGCYLVNGREVRDGLW